MSDFQNNHVKNYMKQGSTELVINGDLTLGSSGVLENNGTITNSGEISGTGDIKTNGLLEISSSGVLNDVDGKYEDLRVPLTGVRVGPSRPPAFGIFRTGGSTDGVRSWLFDAGTEEQLFFAAQVPHSHKRGTDLFPHVHWSPTSTSAGVVRWGLEYTIQDINSVFPLTTIIYGNSVAVGGTGTENQHIFTALSTIDFSTLTGPSVMLVCRLFRDASSTADTYPDDAAGHEFDFHYLVDRLGSVTQGGT